MPSSTSSHLRRRVPDGARLPKGSMQLLDPEQADALYAAMGQARDQRRLGGQRWPGSPRWAAAPASSARSPTTSSAIFEHDMRALGVRVRHAAADGRPPTGRCLILVTPDAQRTMNTSPRREPRADAPRARRRADRVGAILFLEGYLWGPRAARGDGGGDRDRPSAGPQGRLHAVRKRVHRPASEGLMKMIDGGGVDLLFANEDEICS
jgi:hypothetical protein